MEISISPKEPLDRSIKAEYVLLFYNWQNHSTSGREQVPRPTSVIFCSFFSTLFLSHEENNRVRKRERERGRKKKWKRERERENFLFSAAGQARLAPPTWFRDSSPRSRCSPFSLWPSSRVRLLTHAAVTLCSPFDLLSVFRPFRSTPNENKSNQWKGKWNQLDCPLKLFQG